MIVRYQKNVKPGMSGNEKSGESQTEVRSDACRCKETSEMTPRELFKLMIKDLSFWRRVKKK